MTQISASTFDPLARYVNVRILQGAPIADVDLNELDDIRKFELRAYLKWFVGDGVPDGNDGFHITGTGAVDDFTIGAGGTAADANIPADEAGLRGVGRILVDGLDATIAADIAFTAQKLHEDHPGAQVLAQQLGVPPVRRLTNATDDGKMAIYLDVWESFVTADDDTRLLHAGLGVETGARVRRDWAVRVRSGQTAPHGVEPDVVAGHSYSLLAVLTRRAGDGTVRATDVDDRRHRRLQLPPATLIEDVLGTSSSNYRAGFDRPPVSLRDAINALLRGQLPMTPDQPVAPPPPGSTTVDTLARAVLRDSRRGLVTVFESDRGNNRQVYASRMSLDDVAGGFANALRVTDGVAHANPAVAELPDGTLFVVYQSESTSSAGVHAKRAPFSELGTAPELPVAATPGVAEDNPFVVAAGAVVTVFFHKTVPGAQVTQRWYFRRWSMVTDDWVEGPTELAALDTPLRDFHAALDSTGRIWTVMVTSQGIQATWVKPGTGEKGTPMKVAGPPGGATSPPFMLCPRGGGAWLFWQDANGINTSQFINNAWQTPVSGLGGADSTDRAPCAVEDAEDGTFWLIWCRGPILEGDLLAMRRDQMGQWGTPRHLVRSRFDDTMPFAVAGPDTTVWVFWASTRTGSVRIYTKRFVTAV
ncbi:hypothetical protein [Nocardia goodfellowii]|uniref:Uncharacterized protein n=1 Tax=Nocardia goodfellowii TaxID=882446 RepID=A0ABS4QMN0_9NOCA|nr:hypothetical protein [Nocardia goodfellowii]MBP2192960.1 hypothetical protein [Nocardia goodfellowii]